MKKWRNKATPLVNAFFQIPNFAISCPKRLSGQLKFTNAATSNLKTEENASLVPQSKHQSNSASSAADQRKNSLHWRWLCFQPEGSFWIPVGWKETDLKWAFAFCSFLFWLGRPASSSSISHGGRDLSLTLICKAGRHESFHGPNQSFKGFKSCPMPREGWETLSRYPPWRLPPFSLLLKVQISVVSQVLRWRIVEELREAAPPLGFPAAEQNTRSHLRYPGKYLNADEVRRCRLYMQPRTLGGRVRRRLQPFCLKVEAGVEIRLEATAHYFVAEAEVLVEAGCWLHLTGGAWCQQPSLWLQETIAESAMAFTLDIEPKWNFGPLGPGAAR